MSSANSVAYTSSTNLVPVQAEFNSAGVCVGLVGPGGAYFSPPITSTTIDNTVIGGTTPAAVTGTNVLATGELGYGTAAQGAVTQATSKSTAVTLDKSAGRITMNAASLASLTNVTFTLNNSLLSASDILILNVSEGTAGSYNTWVSGLTSGSAQITLRNISGGALAEAVIITFAIIHGA